MKLNPNYILHSSDDCILLVPTADADFTGLIRGNLSVEVILGCLKNDTTQEEIVDALCERFDGDKALMQADVADVVARLKEIGAIDD